MAKRMQKNRVGHKTLSPAEGAKLLEAVRFIREQATQLGPVLNKEERVRLSNPRVGSEPMMDLVLRLAEQRGLRTNALRPEDVRADLTLAEALLPLFQELTQAYQALWDVLRQARSEAWEGSLAFYGILSALGENDPDVELALAPALSFMSSGGRPKGSSSEPAPEEESGARA